MEQLTTEMKEKLNTAFVNLRKAGYFARQNWQCCQTCGWAAIDDEKAKKAVFYHNQDFHNLKDSNACYISWSGDGKEIVKILNDNGILTDWNGSENTRILLKFEV